jgi:hypothetical protein
MFHVTISREQPHKNEIEVSIGLTCGDNAKYTLCFSKEYNCDLWFQRTCGLDNTIFDDENDRFVCKGSVDKWFETVTNVMFGAESFSLSSPDGKRVMHFYFDTDDEKNNYVGKYMKVIKQ